MRFAQHTGRLVLEPSLTALRQDFEACKEHLVQRGDNYKEMTDKSRNKIAELGHGFIRDGSVGLRVVGSTRAPPGRCSD